MSHHRNHLQTSHVSAGEPAHGGAHAGCCATAKPNHDAIAHRAYEIYVKDGCQKGHCEQNWLQAEKELQPVGG
jgi:DUF2934 family protein